MDVVITDHHVTRFPLPQATALINPQQPECLYPFKELAGVGVAYKVAQALLDGTAHRWLLRDLLDLVAIGSIADMAPLRGENRMLVKAGLAQLNGSMRLGIQALAHSSKVRRGLLTAFDVGYR